MAATGDGKRFGGSNQNGAHASECYVSTVSETIRLAVRSLSSAMSCMSSALRARWSAISSRSTSFNQGTKRSWI